MLFYLYLWQSKTWGVLKYPTKVVRFSPALEMWDEVYSSGKSVTPSGCCFCIYLFYFQCNLGRFCPRTNLKGDENMEVIEAFKERVSQQWYGFPRTWEQPKSNTRNRECWKVGKTVLGIYCPVILHFIKECTQAFLSLLDFPRNIPIIEVAGQLPKFPQSSNLLETVENIP